MPKPMRKVVLLSSGNGSTNLGDEAMWLAAAQAIRRQDPDCDIVTDGAATWVPPLPNVTVLPYLHFAMRRGRCIPAWIGDRLPIVRSVVSRVRRDTYAAKAAAAIVDGKDRHPVAESWRKEISEAAAIIFSGAGAMTADYAVHGIFSWHALATLAMIERKPIAFIGQGIGPDFRESHRQLVSEMLSNADLLTVREPGSAALARQIAPTANPIVTRDWALVMHPTSPERARAAKIRADLAGASPFLVVSFHRRATFESDKLSRLAVITDQLAAALPADQKLLFVSNMTGGRYSDDRGTARLVRARMQRPDRLLVVEERLTPGTARALFGLSSGVVGTRYHPLVFALSEGVPVWGLSSDAYYDQKLRGVSQTFGVQGNVSRISDTQPSGADIVYQLRRQKAVRPDPTELDSISGPLDAFLARAGAPGAECDD